MGMTVAVTGGTGFVGRHVVRELLGRGMSVRALVRSRRKAEEALPPEVAVVEGDAADAGACGALAAGAGACINLVGIIREVRVRGGMQTFQRAHVDVVRALVKACEGAGVRRFLHMSALGVSELGEAEYQRTKFEGERIVRASGLDWTVFRPGLIHGPGGEFVALAKGWATGRGFPFAFMPYFKKTVEDKSVPLGPMYESDPVVAPVAVEDVAAAFVTALGRGESVGEVYNLVGSERLSMPDMLRWIRDHVAGAAPVEPHGVPGVMAARVARVAGMVQAGGLLPFDEGMALMGAQDAVAETEKAEAHLGLTFAPFRAAFAAYGRGL